MDNIKPEDLYPKSIIFRNKWQVEQLKMIKGKLLNKKVSEEDVLKFVERQIKVLDESRRFFEKETSYRCFLNAIVKP